MKMVIIACLTGHALCAQASTQLGKLQKFFGTRPAGRYSRTFLEASEEYHLDWHLLPAISMAETGGGSHCRHNNIFGWKSGRVHFHSIPEAIFTVARNLSQGSRYHGRSNLAILMAYNPNHHSYPFRVNNYILKLESEQ